MGERRAFCVHGSFAWPPLPATAPDTDPRPGTVEIFYVEPGSGDASDDLIACLRWIPKVAPAASGAEAPPHHLLSLTDAELSTLLSAANGAAIAFRLDVAPGVNQQWGERLVFRGAALFDQHALDTGDLDLRWLLARRFNWGKTPRLSTVSIGHKRDRHHIKTGASYGFDIALPTPAAQAVQDGRRNYAFAFRTRHAPRLARAAKGPAPVEFLAAGADGDPFHTAAGADFKALLKKYPTFPAHLGGFGFSRSDGGLRFLHLPRGSNIDRQARDEFWLADPKLYVSEILAKLGQVHPRLASKLLLGAPSTSQTQDDEDTSKGEVRNSIDFVPAGGDRRTSRIRFRSAAQATGYFDGESDLGIVDGKFWIADPARTGRYIRSDSEDLLVELELEYCISDGQIWTLVENATPGGGLNPLDAVLRVRVGVGATISADTGEGELNDDDPAPATANIFGQAIRSMRLARVDLANIEATQPQSLLPEIAFDTKQIVRLALCAKLSARFEPEAGPSGDIDRMIWDGAQGARAQWRGADFTITLWPDTERLPLLEDEGNTLSAKMTLPAFAPGTVVPVTLAHDAAEAQGALRRWAFRISVDAPSGERTAMLGGLSFAFATTPPVAAARTPQRGAANGDSHYDFWRFRPAAALRVRPGGKAYRIPDVDFRVSLAVNAVKPLAVDRLRGEREGARPLLIYPDEAHGAGGRFTLEAREQIGPNADRLLTARIIDKAEGETGAGDYLLLSQQPFSIKKVRSQPLSQRGSQDNAYVASYSSDTRGWEFKLVAPTYHYAFPPQGVGETMDKPRRLEIHDPAPDAATPIPPASLLGPDGVARRHAVEFRLTPSAELWIRPSDVERGYFHPEWATEQLFASNGAQGLGAAVAAFRGEFHYGLSVGVDTGRENGAARGARVAEIGALLGRPAGPIESANPDPALRRRWDAVRRSVLRRPERLEMWVRDPGSAAPFAPARFSDGVTFALRNTAVHFPPHQDLETSPPDALKNAPRLVPHGLRGGAIWPLESANFCRALLENPESNGGTIERIALSPGGGDADQRAVFLRGQLAIISETRTGHVQRHRVEIIGRISVFWHRAKHVVVYERTTNPSAQFTPDGGVGQRTRRPVLRKVSEYIELLQPVRQYPDFANAQADSAGFLRAVRFNSRTIHVDSTWSEEVEEFGWRIPLWNRHAAILRPQVYPRPDVAFVTAAEGAGDAPTDAQECLDPDNIYFFADAKAGTADTDAWSPRNGIDCTNLPAPSPDHQPEFGTPSPDGRRKPNAPRIPRGHRRYTWRLAPAARKTILNAERGSEPLYAGLETITFMRSTTSVPDTSRAADLAAAMKGERGQDLLAEVVTALAAFRQKIDGDDDGEVKKAGIALVEQLNGAKTKIDHYKTRLGKLESLAAGGGSRCDKMVGEFTGGLQRKKLLILDQLRAWQANPDLAAIVQDPVPPPEELVSKLTDLLMRVIAPALEGARADIGRIDEGVEQARTCAREFQEEVLALLEGALRKVAEFKASYDNSKPWSPHRLEEYHRRVAAIRDGLAGDIKAAVAEMQSRLATELDAAAQLIARKLGDALALSVAAENGLLASLGAAENVAAALLATLDDRIALAEDELERLRRDVTEVRDTLPDVSADRTLLDEVLSLLDSMSVHAATSRREVQTSARYLEGRADQLGEAFKRSGMIVRALIGDIANPAQKAEAKLKALSAGLSDARDKLLAVLVEVAKAPGEVLEAVREWGEKPDWIVERLQDRLTACSKAVANVTVELFRAVNDGATGIRLITRELTTLLAPTKVAGMLREHVVSPAVRRALAGLQLATGSAWTDEARAALRQRLSDLSSSVETALNDLDTRASNELTVIHNAANSACGALGTTLNAAYKLLEDRLSKEVTGRIDSLLGEITKIGDDIDQLKQRAAEFARNIDKIGNQLTASYGAANAYADRVFEAAGNITSGSLVAAPSNILRLYAAAASAPALPNLDFARERLGYYYKELDKIIDTTPAEAWFGRLGDELKAMGLSLPFNKIGDGLLPDDLSKFDIGRVFKNFGGIDLSKLFGGYKLPAGARDAIRITHAFDKKLFRAWVQIDVNLPLPGRKSLFTLGPFKLDFVGSRMVGMLRLEASKDNDRVAQTGRASLTTSIDAVVSGQSMVTLEDVAIRYERTSGLKVDFDPKKIRLNPSFRFIQDTLGSLFPAEVGGLTVVKRDGIPVGVAHEFTMPPVSLMYGTSGVSNIQIMNSFSLIAYPDFAIANRFALSSPEMPFLFSIFVIGGTGYISVECEYRPFSKTGELMVVVEAAAGGSAALGFAAGPISGSVFITLSIALSYRKLIGKRGGGLTVSLVLLIAGTVDVAGIVSVYIGVLLRMAYRENGQIDGVGTVTVKIRISRFYTLRVRRDVKKVLRKGSGGGGGPKQLQAAGTAVGDQAALRRGRMILEARG